MFSRLLISSFKYAGRLFSRSYGYTLPRFIIKLFRTFLFAANNVDFNATRNGEYWLLEKTSAVGFKSYFDVGANRGDYIKAILKFNPNAEIHAFEILSRNFHVLKQSETGSKVYFNEFGLSDTEGELKIHFSKVSDYDSQATSYPKFTIKSERDYYKEKAICKVERGDNYMSKANIERIDMIKIDVEGHELKVMKGLGKRISDCRLIQFEFGTYNFVSHDLLADFFDYLHGYGFIIGRLLPKGVYFFPYDFYQEIFEGGNYVAIHKDDDQLKEKISLLKTAEI